eukprot:7939455-Alexandrium_andersonii.AAC.1
MRAAAPQPLPRANARTRVNSPCTSRQVIHCDPSKTAPTSPKPGPRGQTAATHARGRTRRRQPNS